MRIAFQSIVLLSVVSVQAGCRVDTPEDAASAPNTQAATASASSVVKQEAAAASLLVADQNPQTPLPDISAALTAIYGEQGDGSNEYALADGRSIGYWYGYAYRSDNQGRYTVFAHAAMPSKTGIPTPGETVALSQITYAFGQDGWKIVSQQKTIGEFGGLARAPEVDAARTPETYTVDSTKAILAVPTMMTATGGVAIFGYELIAFSKAGQEWRYLGKIDAGADYSLSCKNGPATPDSDCVRNRGAIRFVPSPNGGMPTVIVDLTGTTRSDDGNIRQLDRSDALNYQYDETSSTYLDQNPR